MYGMKYTLVALLASSAICPLGLQAQITAGQTCDPAAANDCLASEPLSLQSASAATSRVIQATAFTLFEDLAASYYLPSNLTAGESTGMHMHEGIPVIYMIEGEISIKSENGEIQKVIKKGEAFIGSTNSWHETINTGKTDAVAQVVFIGSTDLKNTVNKE